MSEPIDDEFAATLKRIEEFDFFAVEHDKVCGEICSDYRYFVIALLMDSFNMTIIDLGYIADKLLEVQMEGKYEAYCEPDDSILEAKEIGE